MNVKLVLPLCLLLDAVGVAIAKFTALTSCKRRGLSPPFAVLQWTLFETPVSGLFGIRVVEGEHDVRPDCSHRRNAEVFLELGAHLRRQEVAGQSGGQDRQEETGGAEKESRQEIGKEEGGQKEVMARTHKSLPREIS